MDLDKLFNDDDETEIAAQEEKPVKRTKKKPRGGNSPVIGNNGLLTVSGDNAKFMKVNMVLFNMDKVDIHDVEAVQNRINEFFMLYAENDMKPTVAGMAMSLGMDRRTLWGITHDAPLGGRGNLSTLPPDVTLTIKKAYFILENMWETYMNSGKVNPVAGIFLGKNNYAYRDSTEYVLTPNTKNENDYDVNSIKNRYLTSDKISDLSDEIESDNDNNGTDNTTL